MGCEWPGAEESGRRGPTNPTLEAREGRSHSPLRWVEMVLAFLGAVLAAVAWDLLAPRSADSKGTVVRAPAELRPADCIPGSRPNLGTGPRTERFYRDADALVIGCAAMAGGARVLVAVEPERGGWTGPSELVCFYMAPEGRWDADPRCLTVDPEPEPHCCPRLEPPLWGHDGVSIESAVRLERGGPIYFSGQASAKLASVTVSYRMPSGEIRERAADVLPIRAPIARRIGAAGPFAYFVGEVPVGADTCRGVAVEARDRRGRAVDRQPLERAARAYPSASLVLPDTNACRGRDPLRDAIAEIVWVPLSGLRSLSVLSAGQLADLLQVQRSRVEHYAEWALLPSVRLGKFNWFVRVEVEAELARLRAGEASRHVLELVERTWHERHPKSR